MFSLKESLDLLESRIARANWHWNFLIALNLAVLGWLLTQGRDIERKYKFALTLILSAAYLINLLALLRAQTEMHLFLQEVKSNLKKNTEDTGELGKLFGARSYSWYKPVTFIVHIAADTIILILLWTHK